MGSADTREEFLRLFTIYEWLMVAVTVIVFAAVFYALVRYRRRGDEYPRGKDKHVAAESVYAVVLACIVAVLVTLTFRTEARVDPANADATVRIKVTAFQWQWRFDYTGSGVTVIGGPDSEPELVVPRDEVVEFTGRSEDVIHSLWVPDERFKRDLFPRRTTRFQLRFERLGTHPGHCAEFCGLKHSDMNFRVRVVTPDEFRRWLEGQA